MLTDIDAATIDSAIQTTVAAHTERMLKARPCIEGYTDTVIWILT